MLTLINEINQIKFPARGYELSDVLDALYKIVSNHLPENDKVMLRLDLDHYYHEKGRWLVHKTFAGGIIFLREPEVINKIEILFHSDSNEEQLQLNMLLKKEMPAMLSINQMPDKSRA